MYLHSLVLVRWSRCALQNKYLFTRGSYLSSSYTHSLPSILTLHCSGDGSSMSQQSKEPRSPHTMALAVLVHDIINKVIVLRLVVMASSKKLQNTKPPPQSKQQQNKNTIMYVIPSTTTQDNFPYHFIKKKNDLALLVSD